MSNDKSVVDMSQLRQSLDNLRCRDGSVLVAPGDYEENDYGEDVDNVVAWAVAELARRDVEAVERARPITEEALRTRGGWLRKHGVWDMQNGGLELSPYGTDRFLIVIGDSEFATITTIGQLDDLIAALKGGAK